MLFIIFALATWRLAHMLWRDAGPFGVFTKFRALFIKETRSGTQTRMIGNMLLCMWCLTVWTAMPFAAYLSSTSLEFLAYTTALSGAAMLLHTVQTRLERD